jgi:predicted TIM-barrel fold metal-dependent hydrolase
MAVVDVPHSAGTARPRTAAPPDACDAHIHIYDARFNLFSEGRRFATTTGQALLPRATVADYRLFQQRIGTSRVVVVQPRANGTDNAVTIDAVAQLGFANARGVGVCRTDVTDAELEAMHAGGIRGLRFSVHEPHLGVTTVDMIEPLARRIDALGWHVQLHMMGEQIAAHAAMIERLPCPVVIDHRGRLPVAQGAAHPAFTVIRRLLDVGRTWVKIAGPYLDSQTGGPAWADVAPAATALIAAAPERMLWGSDWPHPTERAVKPDDAEFFDRLADWTPTEATRRRILVDNPCDLYGFANP